MSGQLTVSGLAGCIDHSFLRADATEAALARICDEAIEWGFAAVAVNTGPVVFCAQRLEGTGVGLSGAVGFPLGQVETAVKVFEAQRAIDQGANEIDFVINVGQLKSGRSLYVEHEINEMVAACRDKALTKVILETCYLNDEEKRQVIRMAIEAGADFVKTSTGMGVSGATMPDVLLMRSLARGQIAIKAAGGIRTLDQALAYIDAGATRLGTSRGVALMQSALQVLPQ